MAFLRKKRLCNKMDTRLNDEVGQTRLRGHVSLKAIVSGSLQARAVGQN